MTANPSDLKSRVILQINQAAKLLNVSKDTLRRWEKSGKISSTRTPGGYRIYDITDLITQVKSGKLKNLITSKYPELKASTQKDPKKLLKISEAAQTLGISKDTLRRWEKSGRLEAQRTSGGYRVFDVSKLLDIQRPKIKKSSSQRYQNISNINTYTKFNRAEPEIHLTDRIQTALDKDVPADSIFVNLTSDEQIQSFSAFRKLFYTQITNFLIILLVISPALLLLNYLKDYLSRSTVLPYQILSSSVLGKTADLASGIAYNFSPSLSQKFFGAHPPNYLSDKLNSLDPASRRDLRYLRGQTSSLMSGSNGEVLAQSTPSGIFLEINADTKINGNLTAPNIIYGILPGDNITISEGQTPTISVSGIDEVDTLATVTARGATTTTALTLSGGVTLGNLLNLGNLSSDPSTTVKGSTYYNTTSNKFRCYISTAWANCDTDTDTDTNSGGDVTAVTVGNGLSGGGSSGALTVDLDVTTTSTTTTTSANSGLELSSAGLSLLRGCSNNQILSWDATNIYWACNSVTGIGAGDITAVGSMTSGDAFADSTADDDWLGLGSSAGRIEFDDQSTDEVNILSANVGIGTSTPGAKLEVTGTAIINTGTRNAFISGGNTTLTGTDNVALGDGALDSLTSGARNTALGVSAGTTFASSSDSTFIGYSSGALANSGYNTVVGAYAGSQDTLGSKNSYFGYGAGYSGAGNENSIFGYNAGSHSNFSGANNLFLGASAGLNDTTGSSNVLIGYSAGQTLTTGGNNILIGDSADVLTNNISASIALGYSASVTANNQMVVGGFSSPISDVYIGEGVTDTSATSTTINATGGSGTDNAGASLTLAGGKGTGTGNGGSLIFQVANTGSTGSSLNALGTAFTIAPPNSGTTAVVNGLTLTGAIANGITTLAATGSDSAIEFSIDSKGSDALNLNNNATGDILVAGGAGSTGCTFANATGNLTCAGTISGSGAVGYWTKVSTTLSPATANDIVSIANTTTTGADLAITNTGIYTGTGLTAITANSATSGDILTVSATAATSGSLLTLTGPSGGTAGVTDAGLKIASDVGNIGTSNGLISSTATFDGTTATGVNLYLTSSDAIASANTDYGIYNVVTNTGAIDSAITKNTYGSYTSVSSTLGAPTTAGTTNVYGQYITTTATHAADFGTVNQYGLYVANGTSGTNGTSIKYGLYLEALTGADNNYALGFAGSPNVQIGDAGVLTIKEAGGNNSLLTLTDSTNKGVLALTGGATADLTTIISAAGSTLSIAPSAPSSSGDGVDLNLKGGAATTSGVGGSVNITGGTGAGTSGNNGGGLYLTGGTPGTQSTGGIIQIISGAGGSTSGSSGSVQLSSGITSTGGNSTGNVMISSGSGYGDSGAQGGDSGAVTIQTGIGGATDTVTGGGSGTLTLKTSNAGSASGANGVGGTSGAVNISSGYGGNAGTGNAAGGFAGAISLSTGYGGNGIGSGAGRRGGPFNIDTGAGGTTTTGTAGAGGALTVTLGDGGAPTGAGTSGAGAAFSLTAGNAGLGSATTGAVGGAVSLTAGKGALALAGGAISLTSGQGGASGNGGAITLTTGAGGSASGNSGDMTLNTGSVVSGTAGTINIGTSNTPTINLGDGTQALTLDIGGVTSSNASTINIATEGTTADTITIGNTGLTTSLALSAGTGDITLSTPDDIFAYSTQTNGTILTVGANSAVVLDGTIVGQAINLSTNYTATGFSTQGLAVTVNPTVTNTGSGTYNYQGLVVTGSALSQTTATGTDTWSGADITIPALTANFAGSTVTGNGLKVTTGGITGTAGTISANAISAVVGDVTTAGTQNGVNVDLTGTDVTTAGTINGVLISPPTTTDAGGIWNGINIGNITTSNGTDTALSIGSGWDNDIYFEKGSSVDVILRVTAASGGDRVLTVPQLTADATVCVSGQTCATSGSVGYWSRASTTLSPATANDIVSIANTTTTGADLAITNTGVYTGTGIFNLTANSATTGNIAVLSGTGMTTGEILDLTGTWAPTNGSDNEAVDVNLTFTPTTSAATFRGLDLNVTEGANALANTDYGLKVTTDNSANTSTGTHTIYGGHFTATGKSAGTTTAVGLYSTATGADNNYAAIFEAGSVGIGYTAPATTLAVSGNVLVGAGEGGTPTAATIRGAAASGTNITGADLTFAASNGTGTGGSGALVFQTAPAAATSISADNSAGSTSKSFSYTVGTGTNTMLVVAIAFYDGILGTDVVTGVTYGGQALTKQVQLGEGGAENVSIWTKASPLTGSNTLTISTTGAGDEIRAGVTSWHNVGSVATTGTSGPTSSGTASVTLTTTNADVVIDAVNARQALTVDGSQTQITNGNFGVRFGGSSYETATGVSTTMSWTLSADIWRIAAIALRAPAGTASDTLAEVMRITNTGYVGIGDSSPDAKLDIDSTSTTGGDFLITNTGVGLSGSVAAITANSMTTGDLLTLNATALTTGTALTLTGPSSTGVTDHFIKATADIGSASSLLNLNPDFSGSGVTGYGVYNLATDATSAANTDYGYYGSLALSGNASKTGIGIYSTVTSSSTIANTETLAAADLATTVTGIISANTRNVYGLRSQPTAGAESTGGTTNLYGIYSKATGDVGGGGTFNAYGAYIANGTYDTDGTSTAYGIYLEPMSGAGSNYGICFDCDGTYSASTVASGIQFGSDANAVTLYRSANDTLRTGDNLTVDLDLTVTGGDITGANGAALDIGEADDQDFTFTDNSLTLNMDFGEVTASTVTLETTTSNGNLALNANGTGDLTFTTSTGQQTFTSSNVTGTTTSSGFIFDATAITSGTGAYFTTDSIQGGKLAQFATTGNTLTTGTLVDIRTTATSLTGAAGTGSLLNLDWSPASGGPATGDLFALNIGSSGTTTGNLFNILDAGSSIFAVSETAFTTSLPSNFTSSGDVSVAYDINFTNPTASYIKSAAPLYIVAGETFNSSDLTFQTYNAGSVVFTPTWAADSATTSNLSVFQVTTPVDTTGTNIHQGIDIATTIGNATGGTNTANLINVEAITGDAQVTLNALNIGALTGTAATETAIKIAAGWDSEISLGGNSTASVAYTGISGGAISSTGATNYGINLSTLTGGTSNNYQINTGAITATGTTTNAQLSVGGISGTANGSSNYGVLIGAISSAGTTTTNSGISIGNISGGTSNNYGINMGTLTGGTGSSVYGINTGTLTSVASGNNWQANFGAVAGATSATFGGIQTGALSGAGTTSYGINLGTNASTATTNYGMKIGAISGAGTNNYGLYVDTVSGAGTGNYAAIFAGGNVGIGTAVPNAKLTVGTALSGTAFGTTFNTNAGALGTTATNELSLASIGYTTGNIAALGIRAYRASAGADWTTSAIGLGMDVDNTVRAGASLFLHAGGNVGIGTTGPGYKLDVSGDIRTTGTLYANANNTAYLCGGDDACLNDINVTNTVGIYGIQDSTVGSIKLGSGGGTISGYNGNVGIGVTTPSEKLHVAGGNILIGAQTDAAGAFTLRSQTTAGTIKTSGTASIAKVTAMAVYNGSLYIGTSKTDAAEVYRYDGATGSWTVINTTAGTFNTTATIDEVSAMSVFNGYLYIGTNEANKAEVYRYDGGTGAAVFTAINSTAGTFNTTASIDIVASMAVHQGRLFIGTSESTAAEVYIYNGSTGAAVFTAINANAGTFSGVANYDSVDSLVSYRGRLVGSAGKSNSVRVWAWDGKTANNGAFNIINTSGTFVTTASIDKVDSMAVYNGSLYVGTEELNSAEVYRYDGNIENLEASAWTVINTTAGRFNTTTSIDAVKTMVVYNGSLYIGTSEANAAQIYKYDGLSGVSGTSVFTVLNGTAGTFTSTANIDTAQVMQVYGGDLHFGTAEGTSAEEYTYNEIEGQSYALKFNAKSDNGGGEQNSLLNVGSISFAAEQEASAFAGAALTGTFQFSHGLSTTSGGYDVAEDYPTRDDSLSVGDIVSIDTAETGFVKKAQGVYNGQIVGIYSEKPGLRLSQKDTQIDGARAIPVALAGRVAVKVSLENGPIQKGDYLTSSSTPGVAMKAVRPGQMVGKALEDFSCHTSEVTGTGSSDGGCQGKIQTFVNVSYADPANVLANLLIGTDGSLLASNLNAEKITVSSDINALGLIKASNFSLDASLLNQVGALASIPLDDEGKISVADALNAISYQQSAISNQVLGLEAKQASDSATLAEVAHLSNLAIEQSNSLDAKVASTTANLAGLSQQIQDLLASINGESSESAVLSDNRQTINDKLDLTPPDLLIASGSATLAKLNVTDTLSTLNLQSSNFQTLDATVSATFKSLGETFLGNTLIAGDLTVDGTLSFTNGSTINALPILYFQTSPLTQKADFFNGLITLEKDGTIKAETIIAKQVKIDQISISDKSAGQAIIPEGETEVAVLNQYVKFDSLVILTPETVTSQTLAVADKVEGSGFVVKLPSPAEEEIKFSYLIIGHI